MQEEVFTVTLGIPFPSAEGASIVLQALAVDEPITGSTRHLSIQPNNKTTLRAVLTSSSKRALRTAAHSMLEQMSLATRTMSVFADTMVVGGSSGNLMPSPVVRPLPATPADGALPPLAPF